MDKVLKVAGYTAVVAVGFLLVVNVGLMAAITVGEYKNKKRYGKS